MSFVCGNCHNSHDSVYQARVCYGLIARPAPVSRPYENHDHATARQLEYIKDLGGDAAVRLARTMTKAQASSYIDELKTRKAGKPVTSTKQSVDPRLDLIKNMIDLVPSGYYAVRRQEGDPVTFMRISRPKPGAASRYAGALKVQTQHGPAFENEAVLWPSGSWSIFRGSIIENMMLLVADHQEATLRYGQLIGRCMRCNLELTDERSRHYGIGPDCEKVWPWVIDAVDEREHVS